MYSKYLCANRNRKVKNYHPRFINHKPTNCGSHNKTIITRFSHHSYCSCQKSFNLPTFYVVCREVNCVKTISNSYTLKEIFHLPMFALIAFRILNNCHVKTSKRLQDYLTSVTVPTMLDIIGRMLSKCCLRYRHQFHFTPLSSL